MDMSNFSVFAMTWGTQPLTHTEAIDLACHAEDLGFHSITLPQVPVFPAGFLFSKIPPQYDQYQHDILVLLPMMVQATSRIRIGFNCAVAPWAHPFLWAKYMASLDVASDGRLIAGFGAGGTGGRMKDGKPFNQVLDSFGINSRKRGKMTDEAMELVTKLWTADGPVSHNGEFFQAVDLIVAPKPVQKPYPELWYAGGQTGPGSPPGTRRAARYGTQLQIPWPGENEIRDVIVPQLAAANAEWNGNAELGLLLNAAVRPEGAPSYEDSCALYPHYKELKHPNDEAGTVVVGTPEQCAQAIQRCHNAGAAHFVLDFHRHGLDSADVFRAEMQCFAEQVFPLLL